MTTIGDLEAQLLLKIFSNLTAVEAISASKVQRAWKDAAYDEPFWRLRLLQDWCQTEAITPTDVHTATYREAYACWATSLGQSRYQPVMRHAVQAWTNIKSWLATHAPVALHSLRPGVSEADIQEAEQQLGAGISLELAAIYRVHDGQALMWDTNLDVHHNMPGAQQRMDEMKAARAARRGARATPAAATAAAGLNEGTSEPHTDAQPAELSAGAASQQSQQARRRRPTAGPKIDDTDSGDEASDEESSELPMAGFHTSLYHGLFGGYAFYDHLAVTRMLPLRRALAWTQHLRSRDALRYESPCLVIAASFNFRKYFVVDLASGNIHVNYARGYMPAAPLSQEGEQPAAGATPRTGVLGWLCTYGQRLQTGWYHVENVDDENDECRAICLFPQVGPVMVSEVTRGVRVTATSLIIPEISQAHRMVHAYSIRFQLLSEEEQQAEIECRKLAAALPGTAGNGCADKVVQQCQLMSRHWLILDADGTQMDEVRGEGVIGKYPILTPGCQPFTYQSCTYLSGDLAYMEGDFKFLEGNMTKKSGMEWDVRCPRFTLKLPDYIY